MATLQTAKISREQFEHAIAVLVGVPPAGFSIAPEPGYAFAPPTLPLMLPSELLERRPDVVAAERTAAANARIGVAEAAFFPSLDATDTQGQLIQSSVTLIRNLGGGWQWRDMKQASVNPSVMPRHEMGTDNATGAP